LLLFLVLKHYNWTTIKISKILAGQTTNSNNNREALFPFICYLLSQGLNNTGLLSPGEYQNKHCILVNYYKQHNRGVCDPTINELWAHKSWGTHTFTPPKYFFVCVVLICFVQYKKTPPVIAFRLQCERA
jgi:hypothetical protein